MKALTLCVFTTLLALAAVPAAFAAKKGKPSSNVPAEFLFPPDSANNVLTGDNDTGVSRYKDSDLDAGISAFFMGSGNPKLQVDEHATRALILRLDGSGPSGVDPITGAQVECPFGLEGLPVEFHARGDALWFADLNSDPDGTGFKVGDNNFLSMDEGGADLTHYSIMPLRFVVTENGTDYLYTVLFGSLPEQGDGFRTRVGITRSGDTWTVTGINTDLQSTARIERTDLSQKGRRRVTEYLGHCNIKVYFDIELLPLP
jgi:hypothetical protein